MRETGVVAVASSSAYLAVMAGLFRRLTRRLRDERRRGAELTEAIDIEELERELRRRAREIGDPLDWWDPVVIVGMPEFDEAVALLSETGDATSFDDVVRLASDSNALVASIGIMALARLEADAGEWLGWAIRRLARASYTERYFLLRAIATRAEEPVIGPVLAQADEQLPWQWVGELIEARLRMGEVVDADTFRRHVPGAKVQVIGEMLESLQGKISEEVAETFSAWQRDAIDSDHFTRFGRVLFPPFDEPAAVLVGPRAEVVEAIVTALAEGPRRSVLLVGEHGVGKSALARAALARLPETPFVFEATAAAVNAGASLVGQLEGRVEDIASRLAGKDAVWLFPALEEALYAGVYSGSPTGLLDALLPHVEGGTLTLVAEATPDAYERLRKERPRVASAFDPVRVRPLREDEAIAVARFALAEADGGSAEETLRDAYDLAQQFLPGVAPPGNVLHLLQAAADEAQEKGRQEVETEDVLAALARASGLPLILLDPRAPLSLDEVRRFFEARVLGQRDAVEALVERIALIKAGLNDPTRPLGVFLFVGPTGTGKTELAKALAELLFGSAQRLVRLDMSEFQTPESLERLLSDASIDRQAAPLVAQVRRDPFAVVLLDEFEKAAAPIWDVFLALLEDGRLTDLQGRAVDFRRTIVILTSNVGSALAARPPPGFDRTAEPFRPEAVQRELTRSFRPELLNRIDRVIVFRPLERSQMRAVLEKELALALKRRGLRERPWAIEWDEAALEFLIERGFSPEFGARPLKRAIERHLLAPLARSIVEREVPEGDQFLFVSAPQGREIAVTFVDPDAPEPAPPEPAPASGRFPPRLAALVADPRADEPAQGFLLRELERIVEEVHRPAFQGRKEAALGSLQRPGFWDDPGRFAVLAEAEYLDRLEAALRTAQSLGERLRRRGQRDGRRSDRIVELLASRLYILECALHGLAEGKTPDSFLRVRPAAGAVEEAAAFAAELAAMYAAWAGRRGMRLDRLEGEHLFAVSGLGASVILGDEAGLHVLEAGDGARGRSASVHASVHVVPWEPEPPGERAALIALARRALAEHAAPERVVRRYRRGPSPLVRDAVRGYRSGRLDRVLAGDFDVVG